MSELYIGLMSGTSIDGIDAALVDLDAPLPKLVSTHTESIPASLKQSIVELCTPGNSEIDKFGALDIELGRLFGMAANTLLKKNHLAADAIKAIGSHGQTIRHRPPAAQGERGFSLQIADPNTIAEHTGITTVADFRRRDMAAGGQGAPLAPAFHLAIAPEQMETCAFLNLGGIANITLIHQRELVCGFDTGPANGLMDAWITHTMGHAYDAEGAWAKSGTVQQDILEACKAHPYFLLPAPKSTGREAFNLAWLQQQLAKCNPAAEADVQATLLHLKCETIAAACQSLPYKPDIIYCCGGGTANPFLMAKLAQNCSPSTVATTGELGIDPHWIEACAFAWLASQTLHQKPIKLGGVTGSRNAVLLGGVYYAPATT